MNTANRVLDELYFVTSTVVDWIDIFTRPKYKHIILESLVYCQGNQCWHPTLAQVWIEKNNI